MSHRCRRIFKTCCYVIYLLPCSVIREAFCNSLQARNTTDDLLNFPLRAKVVAWMMLHESAFVLVFAVVFIFLVSPLPKWISRCLVQSPKGFLQRYLQWAPCLLTRIKVRVFCRECQGKNNQNGNGDPEKGGVETPYEDRQDEIDSLKLENRVLKKDLQAREQECSKLSLKVSRLEDDNEKLLHEVSTYKTRLSKMASEKMREDNPTVEDLNDPCRPTALVTKWTGLFRCGEYWTAYENVKAKEGESGAASILHDVCQATYETTKKFVDDLVQSLLDENFHWRSPDQSSRQTLERFFPDEAERDSILGSLENTLSQMVKDSNSEGKGQGQEGKGQEKKAILRLLRSRNPPTELIEDVKSAVGELVNPPELIRSYVEQLTELIYYMRVQDIKVVVDFCKAGTRLNPALYEVESGKTVDNPRSAVVKAVMRPALLRHEQGPVLCKGEVELETSAKLQPGNNSSTPIRDIGTCTTVDLLAASDAKNARQFAKGDKSFTNENKATSQSANAAVVTKELQQKNLGMTGEANLSLQKGKDDSKSSAASPNGGVHDDPAEVGLAAKTGTDQATSLKQETAQASQNDHSQQKVDRGEAATTTAATSPPPPADQGADTVLNMEGEENEDELQKK